MSTKAFIRPQIGILQAWVRIHRPLDTMRGYGWFVFDAAILKFVELPEQGSMILPRMWKGIWIRFAFWVPFDRA